MIKILVTGGAGFIPSNMVNKLLQDKNNYVVAIDNFLTGSLSNLPNNNPENYKFIKADANCYEDLSSIMVSYKFDYVFHYAAVVGVIRTIENPVQVLKDIDGLNYILTLSKNTGVKKVFFSSSSEVYGEPVHLPQNEITTPLNSRLPYAIVKNVGEAYCKSFHQEFGLEYTIFRFFNTYGPNQSTDFVMTKFLTAALENKDITIYGDGSQTRTFCYIDDNIDACYNAFKNNLINNDVVNIGNDLVITILELAQEIIKQSNSQSKIVFLPPLKDGDMSRRQPDKISKMRSILNKDLTSYQEGIAKLLTFERFQSK